eukprot:276270-Chlamydomonas_euryale.AAC.1
MNDQMNEYKKMIRCVIEDFWNDEPTYWWLKPMTTIPIEDRYNHIYLINDKEYSCMSDSETPNPCSYALLRMLVTGHKTSLYAIEYDNINHEMADLFVGFLDGPADRSNIIWAWDNEFIAPFIGRNRPAFTEVLTKPKYAICCALDIEFRLTCSLFNQRHSESDIKKILSDVKLADERLLSS